MRSSNETDDNEIESDRDGDHAGTEASATRAALRASLYYLAFGVAWIVVTDALLPVFVQDVGPWQTSKGIVFVLASAAIIYLLVDRELGERQRTEERGARIAIDDFGTGHSALAYLKNLPCDLVKLDLIFLRGIETSEREDRLLKALVGLGRTLGVQVVAEGVETQGQHDRLAAHDCELAQGFHLGRPMELERLRGLI